MTRQPFGESVESNSYHPGEVVGSDPVPQIADSVRRYAALRDMRGRLSGMAADWLMFEQVGGFDEHAADALHDLSEALQEAAEALEVLEAKYAPNGQLGDTR